MNSQKRFLQVLALLLFVCPTLVAGQTYKPGPQVLTFYSEVDDSEQPYALYLPPNFDESRQYPLVVGLHGAGSNHRLFLRRVFGKSNAEGENDVEASRYFPEWEDVDYIVASTFARGTMGYQGVAEKDVWDMLADVKRRFPIDENRVYLTGLSMGGGGTLWLGLSRPDVWAAIAPVCPAPPPRTIERAPNALNIPVHIFQGGADPVVRPEGVRAWVATLDSLGTQVAYEEYPGVLHDSWVQAYEGGQVFDWFDQFERNPMPERVRFVTDRYKYHSAYWVDLDALTPGTFATIDAQFTGSNALTVATSELNGFTLRLEGHASYRAGESVSVEIDGQRLEVEGEDAVSFHQVDGNWVSGKASAAGKTTGAEGPMSEAVADRHVYVFGTGGNPTPEELQARRATALEAAEWSVHRGSFLGRVMVFPRIISDREVRPSDYETSNLVLFGTKETNSVIAELSDQLPMHLDVADEDHGLVYVYPLHDHYVLVNAGLPWWTSDDSNMNPFTGGMPVFSLGEMDDFLLFKDHAQNVIVGGHFDLNWQLPPPAAEATQATGVVTLQANVDGSN